MDRHRVAKTWVYRGLCDLYFAFDCDDVAFEDNERFSEIMGLEKFLKAFLLFHRHQEYEGVSEREARIKLNQSAIKLGHDFEGMLNATSLLGLEDISRIRATDFDGYMGADLIRAVKAGYMETRYPVPQAISDTFPIDGTEFSHDPLASSGITKFIYALCNACFIALAAHVYFSDMLRQFRETYQHRESFQRFNTLLWEARCKPHL
jgi:hypothetical protein